MPDLLQTLAAYVPPSLSRAALKAAEPSPPQAAQAERFAAAILFADVSGFTPLTEALARLGSEGPEELTRLLNGYFSRMIDLIEAQGGEIVKFSGDAVTVVFPAIDESLSIATCRARQAAEAMQAAMVDFSTLATSAGPLALGMKIGIGAGNIIAAQVGGQHDRWEYVIAGDPLRQVAQAEHQAQRGEIILSPEAAELIAPQDVLPHPLLQPDWSTVQNAAQVEAALRVYVPGTVMTWLSGGLQDWLAVLRPMSVLFIGVSGIDYTQPDAIATLHEFLRAMQAIIYRYEGDINKLAVDDKGTIALALFGAPPYAHSDDPERALRCALDLQTQITLPGVQLAIGVTTGRVFAGPVGSITRREYTVMGDTVNLAARLMVAAGPGHIRCDYEAYRNARNKLAFEFLPPIPLKGKAGLIRVYRPIGDAGSHPPTGQALIGRRAEVARLQANLQEVQAGRSRTLIVEGEAGIGKSRLVEELIRMMREAGMAGLRGAGHSIEQRTPYRAWQSIFTSFFDLDDVDDPAEQQSRVSAHFSDIAPGLIERAPLLNDVLNLDLPETPLTASLDANLRHESLVSLLLTLLRIWAQERPLALILEDAHWLDSLSWDFTVQAARMASVARVPLLLVVVLRPLEEEAARAEPQTLATMPETERLLLSSLPPEEVVALAAARLGVAEAALPSAIAQLIRTRTGGNPFFAEEIIHALRDSEVITVTQEGGPSRCVITGDLDRVMQTLPDTVQGVVLSRIDRLPLEEQLALKVAAVIGRTFAYAPLHATLGEHMEISDRLLKGHLARLVQRELTLLDAPEPELTYVFKHIVMQEVAYETLLFAQRRQLHRTVARWYERTFDDHPLAPGQELEAPLAPFYPLLVYHWHQAEDHAREGFYARLAGLWAAAHFANAESAGYFSRAIDLTPAADVTTRYDLLLAREAVNDLRGAREDQARDLELLAELMGAIGDEHRRGEVTLRRVNYYEATSDYAAALEAAERAVQHAARAQDTPAETKGWVAWGRILWQQGAYDAAHEPLERALALARQTAHHASEAEALRALGNVELYRGNYPAAREYYENALNIYRAIGNRQGEADNLMNLGSIFYVSGDYPSARDYDERALTIYRTTGDRRGETIALGNLGTVYCDLGDYATARAYHQQALDIHRSIDDRWGEATSLVNLGLVHHLLNDEAIARAICERALSIQRTIGERRGEGYGLTYLGHVLLGLRQWEAAAGAYTQALNLRRELGQNSLAVDDLAGLARARQSGGNTAQALQHCQEILDWIAANGLDGIEYPSEVCVTCYQIITAAAQSTPAQRQQARSILSQAHTALLERADAIRDEKLRRQFLEHVQVNANLVALWEESKSLS
jgi:class 3 adenylate cyclase/tetratricopeptide (TPR) repeat protein